MTLRDVPGNWDSGVTRVENHTQIFGDTRGLGATFNLKNQDKYIEMGGSLWHYALVYADYHGYLKYNVSWQHF